MECACGVACSVCSQAVYECENGVCRVTARQHQVWCLSIESNDPDTPAFWKTTGCMRLLVVAECYRQALIALLIM